IGVQVPEIGSNLPPSQNVSSSSGDSPPQTTMRDPVHTALWDCRAEGALSDGVGVQAFATGSYRPPDARTTRGLQLPCPPQPPISLPVQTAVCRRRGSGAPVVGVSVHLFFTGSYRPPLERFPLTPSPPQTIILEPVQTAVAKVRPSGAPEEATIDQEL